MGIEIKRNRAGLYRMQSTISDQLITDNEWVDTQEAKNTLIERLFYDFIDKAIEVDIDFPKGYTVNGKRVDKTDNAYWDWYKNNVDGGGNQEVYNAKIIEIISRIITPEDFKKYLKTE